MARMGHTGWPAKPFLIDIRTFRSGDWYDEAFLYHLWLKEKNLILDAQGLQGLSNFWFCFALLWNWFPGPVSFAFFRINTTELIPLCLLCLHLGPNSVQGFPGTLNLPKETFNVWLHRYKPWMNFCLQPLSYCVICSRRLIPTGTALHCWYIIQRVSCTSGCSEKISIWYWHENRNEKVKAAALTSQWTVCQGDGCKWTDTLKKNNCFGSTSKEVNPAVCVNLIEL